MLRAPSPNAQWRDRGRVLPRPGSLRYSASPIFSLGRKRRTLSQHPRLLFGPNPFFVPGLLFGARFLFGTSPLRVGLLAGDFLEHHSQPFADHSELSAATGVTMASIAFTVFGW